MGVAGHLTGFHASFFVVDSVCPIGIVDSTIQSNCKHEAPSKVQEPIMLCFLVKGLLGNSKAALGDGRDEIPRETEPDPSYGVDVDLVQHRVGFHRVDHDLLLILFLDYGVNLVDFDAVGVVPLPCFEHSSNPGMKQGTKRQKDEDPPH